MKKNTTPLQTPLSLPGTWGRLADDAFLLTTEGGMYRVTYVNHSSPSKTQKYGVNVTRVDGQPVMLFDLLRKQNKHSENVNCAGFHGFGSLPAAIEGMARHFVARFEARAQAVAA